jgi:hypothetical protein
VGVLDTDNREPRDHSRIHNAVRVMGSAHDKIKFKN